MDKITQLFFEHDRWIYAIEKGAVKGISKAQLYQLTKPELRIALYNAVKNGEYEIAPPHTALIPKDTPGEFRTVYVNEPIDRIFLSIANDLLIELMPQSIHPRCKSYQKGIGCGKVVKEISRIVSDNPQGDKVTILNNGECLFEQYKKDLQQILDKMTYNKGIDSALSLGAYRLSKRAMRIIDCDSLFHIPDWNWLGTSNDILEYANYAFEKGKPKVLYIGGILDYHF